MSVTINPNNLRFTIAKPAGPAIEMSGRFALNVQPALFDGKAYCEFGDPVLTPGASHWDQGNWQREVVLTVDTPIAGHGVQHGEDWWECAVSLRIQDGAGNLFSLAFPPATIALHSRASKWVTLLPGPTVDAMFAALATVRTPAHATIEVSSTRGTESRV